MSPLSEPQFTHHSMKAMCLLSSKIRRFRCVPNAHPLPFPSCLPFLHSFPHFGALPPRNPSSGAHPQSQARSVQNQGTKRLTGNPDQAGFSQWTHRLSLPVTACVPEPQLYPSSIAEGFGIDAQAKEVGSPLPILVLFLSQVPSHLGQARRGSKEPQEPGLWPGRASGPGWGGRPSSPTLFLTSADSP